MRSNLSKPDEGPDLILWQLVVAITALAIDVLTLLVAIAQLSKV